jgi:hypothetical protein
MDPIPCYPLQSYHFPSNLLQFCATLQDRYASNASSLSQSDGQCHGIGVKLGGQLTYVGVCTLLFSAHGDLIPNASLFYHVLPEFLFYFSKIRLHSTWSPLLWVEFLDFSPCETIIKIHK